MFHLTGGTPRSLQIFFARMSLTSECLGIAERLFCAGLCHQVMTAALSKKLTAVGLQVL